MGLLSRRGGAQQRRKDAVIVREIPLSPFYSVFPSGGRNPGGCSEGTGTGETGRRRGTLDLARQRPWPIPAPRARAGRPPTGRPARWPSVPPPGPLNPCLLHPCPLSGSVGSIPDAGPFGGKPEVLRRRQVHPEGLTPPVGGQQTSGEPQLTKVRTACSR